MIDLVNCRAETIERGSADDRLQVLERIVVDLMMEIESLRAAMLAITTDQTAVPSGDHVLEVKAIEPDMPCTVYGQTYMETAWLSHWCAGPSSGRDKVLELFYGDGYCGQNRYDRSWREVQMLGRLGFSNDQLAVYRERALAAETCT